MNFNRISTLMGMSVAAVLALSSTAKAATFSSNVTYDLTGTDASKGNIWLNYITQNNTQFNNFSFVNSASIISNTAYTGGNTGAASTDKGDLATAPFATQEGLTAGSSSDASNIVAFLGNRNLNNIIDTEDDGAFDLNLFFDATINSDTSGLDNIFFYERGQNSDLTVRALNASGQAIGTAVNLTRSGQGSAGYSLDTLEIGESQSVGTWGLTLAQLGVTSLSGIKITANDLFDGPDFKVIARNGAPYYNPGGSTVDIPEPTTLIGLGLFAVGGLVIRKKKSLASA